MADVLLAERMRIVQQYDLTTAVEMDKFAQEIILAFGFVHLAAADSKWREVPEQCMRQQLIHHTLDAWDDCLPDLEPIECDADKEKVMFKYLEIFRPLPSPMQTEFVRCVIICEGVC